MWYAPAALIDMRAAVRHNFATGSLEVEAAAPVAAAAAAAVGENQGEKAWLTTSRRSGPSCATRWSKKSSSFRPSSAEEAKWSAK